MKKLSKDELIKLFEECKGQHLHMSLDELLYEAFGHVKESHTDSFDEFRARTLAANGINEYEYYTQNVDAKIKRYVEANVFPEYEKMIMKKFKQEKNMQKSQQEDL